MATLDELERAAESANGLPSGMLSSIRQQETGGKSKYIDDPAAYHYELNSEGRRVAGHTGKISTAFGPYGILESTAAKPGYGVTPLQSKALEDQVNFAASYLAGRSKQAGSLEGGLAGYGEGGKYANQVLKRINMASNQQSGNAIDQLAVQNVQRTNVAADALESMYGQMQASANRIQETGRGVAADTQLVETTKALALAETQKANKDAAVMLGTDPSAASYALKKLSEQANQLFEKQLEVAQQIQDGSDPSNLFKNPFKFAFDRVFMDSRKDQFNALNAQSAAVNNRMVTLHNITQESAQTNALIAQSVTTGSAEAIGRVAAADVTNKLEALNIDALRTNAQGVTAVTQMRNSALDIALKQRDQQIQEASVGQSRANAALQAESLRLAMEERKDRVTMKQEALDGQRNMLATINAGRAVNGGLPPFRSFEEMQTAAKMDKNIEAQIGQQYLQGLAVAQTGRATVASDPWGALKYQKMTGAEFADGRAKVFSFLDKVNNAVQNSPQIPQTDKAKEATLSGHVNKTATAQAGEFLSNIMGGKDNIYAPPNASAFLSNPSFASSYISMNILTPMVKAGIEEINPKNITNSLVADMKAGKISMEQVSQELGFMAELTKGYNNELYRYNDTAGLPNMKTVKVPLDDTGLLSQLVSGAAGPGTPGSLRLGGAALYGMFGGPSEVIVDLANPIERDAYLNKRQAALLPPVLRQQAAAQSKTK